MLGPNNILLLDIDQCTMDNRTGQFNPGVIAFAREFSASGGRVWLMTGRTGLDTWKHIYHHHAPGAGIREPHDQLLHRVEQRLLDEGVRIEGISTPYDFHTKDLNFSGNLPHGFLQGRPFTPGEGWRACLLPREREWAPQSPSVLKQSVTHFTGSLRASSVLGDNEPLDTAMATQMSLSDDTEKRGQCRHLLEHLAAGHPERLHVTYFDDKPENVRIVGAALRAAGAQSVEVLEVDVQRPETAERLATLHARRFQQQQGTDALQPFVADRKGASSAAPLPQTPLFTDALTPEELYRRVQAKARENALATGDAPLQLRLKDFQTMPEHRRRLFAMALGFDSTDIDLHNLEQHYQSISAPPIEHEAQEATIPTVRQLISATTLQDFYNRVFGKAKQNALATGGAPSQLRLKDFQTMAADRRRLFARALGFDHTAQELQALEDHFTLLAQSRTFAPHRQAQQPQASRAMAANVAPSAEIDELIESAGDNIEMLYILSASRIQDAVAPTLAQLISMDAESRKAFFFSQVSPHESDIQALENRFAALKDTSHRPSYR